MDQYFGYTSILGLLLPCCLPSLLSPLTAQTTAPKPPPWQTIVQWDNDLLMTGTDQDYTNGARIAFQREFPSEKLPRGTLKDPLRRITGTEKNTSAAEIRFGRGKPLRYAWGVGLTQIMYTPTNPNAGKSPAGERPYAGWLGVEFSLQAMNDQARTGITLSLGTTGDASLAEDTQDWVHENISNSPLFQGWNSQLEEEFTVNLHFDHKRRLHLLEHGMPGQWETDGYGEWGIAGGNFRTNSYLGGLIRFGYNLPPTYSIPRVQLGSYGAAFFREEARERKAFSLLGFTGLRGSLVIHDITLDGSVFPHSPSATESKILVGEWLYGLQLRWNAFDLSLSNTLRTTEFKGQDKHHSFGSVMLRWRHCY
ncbi:MAG: lipid A deacylase LpxR family protein [Coraliomargaritaceae bacterium]